MFSIFIIEEVNVCWDIKPKHFSCYLVLPYWVTSYTFGSIHPEVFLRKSVLKICSKFTGQHPCRSVISIKLLCTSPVNLLHIFRTTFPRNTSGRLLLKIGLWKIIFGFELNLFLFLLYFSKISITITSPCIAQNPIQINSLISAFLVAMCLPNTFKHRAICDGWTFVFVGVNQK